MNSLQKFVWGNKKKSQVATINGDYLYSYQLDNFKTNGYFFNDSENYYGSTYITTYYPYQYPPGPEMKIVQDDKLYSKIKVVVKQPDDLRIDRSCPNEYGYIYMDYDIIIVVRLKKNNRDTIFYNLGMFGGEFILNLPEPQKIDFFYGGLGTITANFNVPTDFNTCASNGVTITISDPIVSYELIE